MSEDRSFSKNLERVSLVRHEIANQIEEIVVLLTEGEARGKQASGKLSLDNEIKQLQDTCNDLRHSKFKLLVLGDMKRGKSTFINALVGEKLLPSDVNPCTALPTVLRYGEEKVTIYFKDGSSRTIDVAKFQEKYTIEPNEAKALADRNKLAFPNVDYAAIEYPLPLLKDGLEIIDSPGLNDTEARNELTLQHIHNCHAVLFLFKAMQPCTLNERRYLKNYLLGRDLTIFFIINAWDEIKQGLVNPEDPEEVGLAENKIRQVFQANLNSYLTPEDCHQKLFEISALTALRRKVKDREADLSGTGFPEFLDALNSFLNQDSAIAEFKHAHKVTQRVSYRLDQAINRRIPLLDETIVGLKRKITNITPEFEQLQEIRNKFQQEIETVKQRESQAIANSFADYIISLEKTFEADFLDSQPEINYNDFLDKNKRDEFQDSFKRAFERYLNDRLASWEFTAKQELTASFDGLNKLGEEHQLDYERVVEAMNRKLLGSRFRIDKDRGDRVSPWADSLGEMFFDVPDSVNGAISSFNAFWQTVLASICITIGLRIIGLLFTSVALNIFGAILLGIGTIALQAEYVRRQFLDITKKEFVKYLPQIAEEQKPLVYASIQRCFDAYEQQVMNKINLDLQSRQQELANLVEQKENHEIDRVSEIERLNKLKANITARLEKIEQLVS